MVIPLNSNRTVGFTPKPAKFPDRALHNARTVP